MEQKQEGPQGLQEIRNNIRDPRIIIVVPTVAPFSRRAPPLQWERVDPEVEEYNRKTFLPDHHPIEFNTINGSQLTSQYNITVDPPYFIVQYTKDICKVKGYMPLTAILKVGESLRERNSENNSQEVCTNPHAA